MNRVDPVQGLSAPKLALLARDADANRALLAAEPIAVVGMGCRFPGGAIDADSYWQLLRDGVDAVTEVPRERWNADEFFDPDPDATGKLTTRWGAFLPRIDEFDAAFFGIAPREAAMMAPEQRLLLEVTWEALEHAGIAPDALAGSRTGVFVSAYQDDYARALREDAVGQDLYTLSGTAHSIAANRLSYVLDLRGPSIAIDTACSASLVAVHLACNALRARECDVAVAGGANAVLSAEGTLPHSRARLMAADGRCKTFDARADGFVRGEGCGIAVLKRLSDALAAGDRVLAVVRGSAVNQDGRTSGLTAPSGPAQERVMRSALTVAGLSGASIGYVEAHGTGTALGDPIELEALAAVYGQDRSVACQVGSVKTNLGHQEAAAGIAGFLKAVLALHHIAIPPSLHFLQMNPHVRLEGAKIEVPTRLLAWPKGEAPHRAAVSAFGFGGTNAHVVLEEAPQMPVTDRRTAPILPLALSAAHPESLQRLAERYAARVEGLDDAAVAEVAAAALSTRARLPYRLSVPADRSAAEALRRYQPPADASEALARPSLAFVFTGQGALESGAGRVLFEREPVFRAALERADEILRPHLPVSLLSALYGTEGGALLETETAQPALVAFAAALVELWQSRGVRPALVAGHSAGDIAAACAAGAIDLESALRFAATRGRLMQRTAPGAMAAFFADEGQVEALLVKGVVIAAHNAKDEVVVSGSAEAVDAMIAAAQNRVETRRLRTNRAFHSATMDAILEELAQAAATITWSRPRVPLVSALSGTLADQGWGTPAYWREHARAPVRWAGAVESLRSAGVTAFLEIGPRAVLSRHIGGVSSLGGASDEKAWANAIGRLFVHGVNVTASAVRVPLPLMAFRRRRHWHDVTSRPLAKAGHPHLGQRLSLATTDIVFESRLGGTSDLSLDEHLVAGSRTLPAAALIEMVRAAGASVLGAAVEVTDMVIPAALRIPIDETRTVQVVLSLEGGGARLRILVREGETWRPCAEARVTPFTSLISPGERPTRGTPEAAVDGEVLRGEMAAHGLTLGAAFGGIVRAWCRDDEILAEIETSPAVSREQKRFNAHPALLDACLQPLGLLAQRRAGVSVLPFSVDRIQFAGSLDGPLWAHAKLTGDAVGDVTVFDGLGQVVALIKGLLLRPASSLPSTVADGVSRARALLYQVDRDPLGASTRPGPLATQLLPALRARRAPHRAAEEAAAQDLNALCAAYASQALDALGTESVLPRYEGLLHKLAAMREALPDVRLTHERALRDHPTVEPELTLLGRTGPALADVLRGRVDPLTLLFPDGDDSAAQSLNHTTPLAQALGTTLADAVSLICAARGLPRLRVLEIGAGTGGATAHVLPRLDPNRVDYVFTDLGRVFLERARSRFGAFSGFRTAVLDADADPLTQGFSPASFDLVIAANVLHATRDLRETLGRLDTLLAPGGWLLALEVTASERWADLTFGLTEGWWRFRGDELRATEPLLPAIRWTETLRGAGFEADAVEDPEALVQRQALIVARKPVLSRSARPWRVLGEGNGLADATVAAIQAAGGRATRAFDTDADAAGWIDLRALDAIGDPPSAAKTICANAVDLVKSAAPHPSPIVWVTRFGDCASGLAQGPLAGLARVAGLEHPGLSPLILRFDDEAGAAVDAQRIVAAIEDATGADEIEWSSGSRRLPRLRAAQVETSRGVLCLSPGSLESLTVSPREARRPEAFEVLIRVHASALNFRDVLTALDRDPEGPRHLGAECVGTVVEAGGGVTGLNIGDRVAALTKGALGTHVTAPEWCVTRLPSELSFLDAATLPVPFLTAAHGLLTLARLRSGERVLVHAAAGGVGMAAVQLALSRGALVVATAARHKHDAVRPLGVERVLDSRDLSFPDSDTFFDAAIGAVTGSARLATLRTMRPGGRYVEIGLGDRLPPQEVPAGIEYLPFDLNTSLREAIREHLGTILADAAAGRLRPLPRRIFALDEPEAAFRLMAQSRHVGRVLIAAPPIEPTASVRSDRSFVVTGGTRGVGLATAGWLVERGARALVLVGRTEADADAVEALRSRGAQVLIHKGDVSDVLVVRNALQAARELMPLGGVVHSAGIVDDGLLVDLDASRFESVFRAKVTGAWHLHQETRRDELDLFVLYGSAASLLGSPGQANHAAANAGLDALARMRRAEGLPAMSISWGTWSGIGRAAALDARARERWEARGVLPFSPETGLDALSLALQQPWAQVGVFDVDWDRMQAANPRPLALLSSLETTRAASPRAAGESEAPLDAAALKGLSPRERVNTLQQEFARELSRILGLDPRERVPPARGFHELGLDSLTALEVRNRLQKRIGRPLPATVCFDHPNLDALTAFALRELGLSAGPSAAPQPSKNEADVDDVLASLADVSEVDAEAGLRGNR